ncbi:MAG: type II secretion system F family protein, partial [Solirubrobacteraceae bacterium]
MSDSYVFRAVDNLGVKHKGEVESDSAEGVRELLKGRGLLALEVKAKTSSMELSFDVFSRVKLEDLALMTRQLATMLSSGLSLMRALTVLEGQTQNKRLQATIVSIRQDIESGGSLSTALGRHPKVFSQLYVAMIRAGETGGFLEDAMLRVAEQLESQNKLHRQVKSAMVYPAVVSSIALG